MACGLTTPHRIDAKPARTVAGGDPVTLDEIRWSLEPLPAPDPLALSDAEQLLVALAESAVYRSMVLAAMRLIREQAIAESRMRDRYMALLEEYRALRARAA